MAAAVPMQRSGIGSPTLGGQQQAQSRRGYEAMRPEHFFIKKATQRRDSLNKHDISFCKLGNMFKENGFDVNSPVKQNKTLSLRGGGATCVRFVFHL